MSIESQEIIIDLGGIRLTIGEMLEIIKEERQRILEKYGIQSIEEIPQLIASGRVSIDEILEIRHKLLILDEMEDALFEEIFIHRGGNIHRLIEKISLFLKIFKHPPQVKGVE